MTRETKVGLLIGVGMILLIGIIVSDFLSVAPRQEAPDFTPFGEQATNTISPGTPGSTGSTGTSGNPALSPGGSASAANSGSGMPSAYHPTTRSSRNTTAETGSQANQAPNQGTGREQGSSSQQDLPAQHRPGDQRVPEGFFIPTQIRPLEAMSVAREPGTSGNVGSGVNQPQEAGPSQQMANADQGSRQTGNTQPYPGINVPRGDVPAVDTRQMREQRLDLPDRPLRRTLHEVKQGESLWSIAQQHYGDGSKYKLIADANRTAVGNNDRVNVGTKLVIPALEGEAAPDPIREITTATTTQSDTGSTTTRPRTIKVEARATLSGLAREHLGSAGRWPELLEANRDQLNRPEDLREGMILKLPAQPANNQQAPATQPQRETAPSTPAAPSRTATASSRTHTVQSGDTLVRLSRRYFNNDDRWQDIYEANRDRIDNPDRLSVGTVLRIPG